MQTRLRRKAYHRQRFRAVVSGERDDHDLVGGVLSLIIGGAFMAVFGYFGVHAWREYRAFDDDDNVNAPTDATAKSRHKLRLLGSLITMSGASFVHADFPRDVPKARRARNVEALINATT